MGLDRGEGKEEDPAPVAVRPGDTLLPHVAAGAGSHGYWDTDAQLHSGPPGLRGIAYSKRDREQERVGRWNMAVGREKERNVKD